MLTGLFENLKVLSSLVCSSFRTCKSLTIVSLQIYRECNNNQISFKQLAKRILTNVQTSNRKFEHIQLTVENERMEFSLPFFI